MASAAAAVVAIKHCWPRSRGGRYKWNVVSVYMSLKRC